MFRALIDFSMHYSRTVIGLMAVIIIAGVMSYIAIPKEAQPDVSFPVIYVSTSLEGIAPADAEKLLVQPLESELRTVEGVTGITATGYLGGGNVILEFDPSFDSNQALDDVKNAVDKAKADLPDDAKDPVVTEINISEFPILVVALFGDLPEREMLNIMRRLQDRVEAIGAVLEANISGQREEIIEANFEPSIPEFYNLNLQQVIYNIASANTLVAAGSMENISGSYDLKVPGLLERLDQILSLPIKSNNNSEVRVGDVATLQYTFDDPQSFARVNGEPALSLGISKRAGENIIKTIEEVRQIIAEEQKLWPEGVQVVTLSDQSQDIRQMLSDLLNNVLAAIVLVMVVIVAALGFRSGILVGIAIPGSYLIGFLVLNSLGMTVNIVVLFSLILASGMLVDGAIIVIEYADRRLKEGKAPLEAYGEAAKRMAWPITTSTITTLAAFAPLAFWPGLVGEFMKYLPITLLITLSASLVMALIFMPVLGALLASQTRKISALFALVFAIAGFLALPKILGQIASGGLAVIAGLVGFVLIVLGAFGLYKMLHFLLALDKTARIKPEAQHSSQLSGPILLYISALRPMLRVPEAVLVVALIILGGSFYAFGNYAKSPVFFPSVEPAVANINIRARGNLSIWERDALVRKVEERILDLQREHKDMHAILTTVGKGSSSGFGASPEDQIGTILLEFADNALRRPVDVIKQDIRERTQDIAGILIEMSQEEAGPPQGKAVQLELSAAQGDLLEPATVHVLGGMDQLGGFIEVESGLSLPGIEWQLEINRDMAARYDVSIGLLGQYVKLITGGINVTSVRIPQSDEEIDVIARLNHQYRSLSTLEQMKILTKEGQVPLNVFIERKPIQRTGVISRTDAMRSITIKANIMEQLDGQKLTNVDMVKKLEGWLSENPLESGVNYKFVGEDESQKEAATFLMQAFMVAIFLMVIVLVTQFNSYFKALLVLSAIIFSIAGVLIGILITGQTYVIVMSSVGIIALAGIVVNNNIVLIDTYNELRGQGQSVQEAILLTSAQRFRPIMLTAGTTVLGLVPMATQMNINFITGLIEFGTPSTQWWVALSSTVIFGLSFATLITLFFTPCMLKIFEDVLALIARIKAKQATKTKSASFLIRALSRFRIKSKNKAPQHQES